MAHRAQEGWAVWGWELADDLFEFRGPGGVRRRGLGPAPAVVGHRAAPAATLLLVTLVSPDRFPVVARAAKPALPSS